MSDAPRIWVTGPVKRLTAWCAAARAAGWEPIAEPLVEIVTQPFDWPSDHESFDWLCVTSANAMSSLARHVGRLAGVRVAVVGAATEAALRALSIDLPLDVAIGPTEDSEELQRLWEPHVRSGDTVLWPRSDLADEIGRWLQERGAVVVDPIAYANRPRLEIEPPACDAVFFASPSAVHAFVANPAHPSTHLGLAIGATTARALEAVQLDDPTRVGRADVLDRPAPEALTRLLGGGS